jgi:uncharacterized protein GlcG (DUF336 family)
MCGLTLQEAEAIVQGALAKARELKCKPMTVAVVDAGGAAVVMKREDGSGVLRPDIAFAKAWGPIGMGIGGRAMAKRAMDTPAFWAALNTISAGRIAPVAGGVLILKEGKVVGSIGMSGDLPDNDEACCIAGAQSAGFETEVGEAALGKQ